MSTLARKRKAWLRLFRKYNPEFVQFTYGYVSDPKIKTPRELGLRKVYELLARGYRLFK